MNSLGFVRILLDSFGSSRFLENLGFLGFARIPQEFNDLLGFARIPRIRKDSVGFLRFATNFNQETFENSIENLSKIH